MVKMSNSRKVSPARSQGAIPTPRCEKPRRTRSVGSPALSNASGRLASIIQEHRDKNVGSLVLSPLPRKSVLTDNTDIGELTRESWWKKLDENSRDVMEVLEDNNAVEFENIFEELGIEVRSPEKKNYSIDIPDSSDNESIKSIVLPQRKLFPQKENIPQKKFGDFGTRETLDKLYKTNIGDNTLNTTTKVLFQSKPRSKPIFPAALLNISPNSTTSDKTLTDLEPKGQVRNIFGNRQTTKRKNMFANFIASESEDEITEIQLNVFGFQKSSETKRCPSSLSRGVRDASPTSSVTIDMELDDWKLLPSSTMVENQLDIMFASGCTPKKARLCKLSEGKESEAGTSSMQSKSKTMTKEKSPELDSSEIPSNKSRDRLNKSKITSLRNTDSNISQSSIITRSKNKSGLVDAQKNIAKIHSFTQNKSAIVQEEQNSIHLTKDVETISRNEEEEELNFTLEYDNDPNADEIDIAEKSKQQNNSINKSNKITKVSNNTSMKDVVNKSIPKLTNKTVEEFSDIANQDGYSNETIKKNSKENPDNILQNENIRKVTAVNDNHEESSNEAEINKDMLGQKSHNKERLGNKSQNGQEDENNKMEVDEVEQNIIFNVNKEVVNKSQAKNGNKELNQDLAEKEKEQNEESHNKTEELENSNENCENREQNQKIAHESDQELENHYISENEVEQNKILENESQKFGLCQDIECENENKKMESQEVQSDSQKELIESQEKLNVCPDKRNESEEEPNDSQIIVNKNEEEHNKSQEESNETEEELNKSQEIEDASEKEHNESQEERNESEEELNKNQEMEDASEEEHNESQEVGNETEEQEIESEAENEDEKNNESQEVGNETEEQEIESEAENEDEENNESQEVGNETEEQEIDSEAENEDEKNNESQEVGNETEEQEIESEAENEDEENNESQEVENEQQNISEDEIDQNESEEVDLEMECDARNESIDNEAAADISYQDNSQEDEKEAESDQNEIAETPNVSHDTTGRNRKKVKSPEVILHDTTNQTESFAVHGGNTSVRKSKSMIKNLNIRPSFAPDRESMGLSDGTKNSSAEGSGWDSHRTTRKTLRQTFGKDFTPRKSLRALVMEKSAKRQIETNNMTTMTAKFPLANSTEYQEESTHHDDFEMNDEPQQSDHEGSRQMKQTTLEMYLQKIKQKNLERRIKLDEEVRNSLKLKAQPNNILNQFKVPARPMFPRKTVTKTTKPKAKAKPSNSLMFDLPEEIKEDMKYKPPKRFQPSNAAWITKRLYNYLETKLKPKYNYKARVRAEKLVENLYNFTKEVRRRNVASTDSVDDLKHEFARLNIVKTHFEFYDFIFDFMPREIRIKVIPDLVNKIPQPRRGIFSDIL